MKISILIFLFLILFSFNGQAQILKGGIELYSVKIKVFDLATDKPIEGVMVRGLDFKAIQHTDECGVAVLELPEGIHQARITHPGYVGATTFILESQRFTTVPHEVGIYSTYTTTEEAEIIDAKIRSKEAQDPGRDQIQSSSLLPMPPMAPLTIDLPDTIQIIHDGVTTTINLEEYVKGVLPKEIGTSFPFESMKAQAVAARTYGLMYYLKSGPVCTTAQCQVWGPTHYDVTDKAVDETKSVVAAYDGKMIWTYFAASCGGHTKNSEDVWVAALPYARGVPCIENKQDYCEQVCTPDISENSLCWGIWGHRVGLCQRGAQSMGKCDYDFIQILTHYYTDIELANLPDPEIDDAVLFEDIPPADAYFKPQASFTWTLTFQNKGTTVWTKDQGYILSHVEGEDFGKPGYLVLNTGDSIQPEQNKTWTLDLEAPAAEGTYRGYWQMARWDEPFGEKVWIDIVVKSSGESDISVSDDVGNGSDAYVDKDTHMTKDVYSGHDGYLQPDGYREDMLPGNDASSSTPEDVSGDDTLLADTQSTSGASGGCRQSPESGPVEPLLFPLLLWLLFAFLNSSNGRGHRAKV